MSDIKQYAERDHMAQGAHYLRHVDAMTGEGLHAKSAIAGELAHRDLLIDAQAAEIARQQRIIEGYARIYNDAMTALRDVVSERDRLQREKATDALMIERLAEPAQETAETWNALQRSLAEIERLRAAQVWTCFHCGEVCTDAEAARLHFGSSEHQQTGCQIDLAEYRRMEELNRRHCEEDTDLHRALHSMESAHQQALRREEEAGYAKGLRDGCAESAALTPQQPAPQRLKEKT